MFAIIFYLVTSLKCRPPGRLFSNAASSEHVGLSVSKTNRRCCVLLKLYLFSVSIFALCLLFIAWLAERERQTSDSSIQNRNLRPSRNLQLMHQGTSGITPVQNRAYVSYVGVDRKGAEFIANNEQKIHSLTYRH